MSRYAKALGKLRHQAVLAAVLPLALLTGLASPATSAEPEGPVYVELRASESSDAPVTERWKLYGSSYALVIGIDDYANGWPRLSNAVEDAKAVAEGLEARGFQVQLLLDPGSAELRAALRAFFARKGIDPEARLFLWYAGHGYSEYSEGYLVPADAPPPHDPDFLFQALHMGDIGAMVRVARSKHIFAVFDSCFAGTIFNASRARPPAAVTRAVTEPVRQFLTSGDADQEVSDDGTFRHLFLGALDGEERADANGDGYLTGTELSLFLENRMVNLTDSAQTPRSGKLRDRRFDRGDFIFLLPQEEEPQVAALQGGEEEAGGQPGLSAVGADLAVELAFWETVRTSESVEDYQAYLTAYPEGRFAILAETRIRQLQADRTQQEPPQPTPQDDAAFERNEAAAVPESEPAPPQTPEEQVAALPPEQDTDPAADAESALSLSRAERRELQRALTALGYDTRGVDGIFGPGTRNAIRGYQAARGAEETGYLTASLAETLRAEAPPPPEPGRDAEPELGLTEAEASQPAAEFVFPSDQAWEEKLAKPEKDQTAALGPDEVITEAEIMSYVAANKAHVNELFRQNNDRTRVLLKHDNSLPRKVEVRGFDIHWVIKNRFAARVTLTDPTQIFISANSSRTYVMQWTGNGFKITSP